MNIIQQVSATEFRLVKGNHDMTLSLGKWGWEMVTFNPSTRAWNSTIGGSNFGSFRRFATLADVEKAYKSWRGITQIVEAA